MIISENQRFDGGDLKKITRNRSQTIRTEIDDDLLMSRSLKVKNDIRWNFSEILLATEKMIS